jgi:hypothetical protein
MPLQEPNAYPGYRQGWLERILLRPGWRFQGLAVASTRPWRRMTFIVGVMLMLIIASLVFGDVTEWLESVGLW